MVFDWLILFIIGFTCIIRNGGDWFHKMTIVLDPHLLVAFMVKSIGVNHDHGGRHANLQESAMIGRMLEDDEGNKRTCPIMDAFASLCVSASRHQVVAIALQWNVPSAKVQFTIAENGLVKESIRPYLLKIWKLLQQLGKKFVVNSAKGDNPTQWQDFKGVSPGMPPGIRMDTKLAIFSHIYSYTQKKNRVRVGNWLPEIETFMNGLDQVRGGQLDGLERELKIAVRALRGAYKVYDVKKNIDSWDSEHWTHLHALLEMATNRVRRLTDTDNPFCDRLAANLGISFSPLL